MFEKIKELDIVAKMSIIGLVAAIFIAITIGIISLALGRDSKESEAEVTVEETVESIEEVEEQVKDYRRIVAVVKNVDADNYTLTVYEFENSELITLVLDGTISIKNEYGAEISLAQLSKGDIIESKYDMNTFKPEDVKISANAWERKNVTDIIVDSENKTIRIASDKYNYDDELVTLKDGVSFSLDELDPVDKLTVKGYKNNILTIALQTGHGTITLINHNKYIGGIMEVDKKTYDIVDQTSVTVSAGVQSVIVSNENLTSIVKKVLVNENEESVIDLGDVVPDNTIVNFIISQEDATLYINDEIYENHNEPITLEYGEYDIRVEKDEYTPWEGKLVATEAYMDYAVNLEERLITVKIADPEGFSVFIGTEYLGEIPVETTLDEGNHTVTIRKDGYYSKMYNIQLEDTGRDYNYTFAELIEIVEETTIQTTEATATEAVVESTDAQETTATPPTTPTDDVYNTNE